ncbi:MAG: (2Fe-2S)-binding protein [Methylovulum sp.]|nr:(2Fe-2S)-binding protein [Methylovulum sp.]
MYMYICVCKAVTNSQILTAIENGACTRRQLTQCFGLGKDCGKCNKDVIALLEQTVAPVQPLVAAITAVLTYINT